MNIGIKGMDDKLKGWQVNEHQENEKKRLEEGKYINKSLFFLTQVINHKTANGELSSHVPYRNSSLTKILKSSLCGNTKTCVILCLAPTRMQFDHSLQTLKFGMNINKIETKPEKNIIKPDSEEILKSLIQEYQSRISFLDKNPTPSSLIATKNIEEENNMLWEQFIKNGPSKLTNTKEIPKDKILLQFYVKDDDINSNHERIF